MARDKSRKPVVVLLDRLYARTPDERVDTAVDHLNSTLVPARQDGQEFEVVRRQFQSTAGRRVKGGLGSISLLTGWEYCGYVRAYLTSSIFDTG